MASLTPEVLPNDTTSSLLLEINSSLDLSGISAWPLLIPNSAFMQWKALSKHILTAMPIEPTPELDLPLKSSQVQTLTHFIPVTKVSADNQQDTCELRLTEAYAPS